MYKFVVGCCMFLAVTTLSLEALEKPTTDLDRLIAALIQVESNGNDRAVGDRHLREMAYGPLQIRRPCVEDVNRRYRTNFKAQDALGNRELSVWICRTYILSYATKKQLGREPTLEDMARIWNGGPAGWKRESTIKYWKKVQRLMYS
jgi:hypothetical protein